MKRTWIAIAVMVAILAAAGAAYAGTAEDKAVGKSGGFPVQRMRAGAHPIGEIAKAAGMEVADLLKERQAGKSFAEILRAKGKDVDAFVNQLVATHKASLDKLVAAGKLTQEKADAALKTGREGLKKMLEDATVPPTGKKMMPGVQGEPVPPGSGQRFGRGMAPKGGLVGEVAKAAGMEMADVVKERQAGKSFAQILTAKGKDANALVNQIVASRKESLDKMVAAGKLTQDKAAEFMKGLQENVKKMMEDTSVPPARKPGEGPQGRPGFRGFKGFSPKAPKTK